MVPGFDQLVELRQNGFDVADEGDGDLDIFADGGWIDIDVDDISLGGEFAHIAGDAVIETDADGDEQVRFLDGIIGISGAVHAQHFQGKGIGLREGAQSHQAGGDRGLNALCKQGQLFSCAAGDDPAAGEDDRFFGAIDAGGGLLDLRQVALDGGLVAADDDLVGIRLVSRGLLDILGHVDQHRTRAAGAGDVKKPI